MHTWHSSSSPELSSKPCQTWVQAQILRICTHFQLISKGCSRRAVQVGEAMACLYSPNF